MLQTELAPCGIALDAEEGFLLSPLAAFCMATRSTIADPAVRRSALSEWHMQALLERGFCVLLPSLREDLGGKNAPGNNVAMRTGQVQLSEGVVSLFFLLIYFFSF